MLRLHSDHETNPHDADIFVSVELMAILDDVSYLINGIYLACRDKDPFLGALFKGMLQTDIRNGSSRTWEVSDTHEAGEDGVKRVSAQLPKDLMALLDGQRGNEHGE